MGTKTDVDRWIARSGEKLNRASGEPAALLMPWRRGAGSRARAAPGPSAWPARPQPSTRVPSPPAIFSSDPPPRTSVHDQTRPCMPPLTRAAPPCAARPRGRATAGMAAG
ncbi:hypothetical protein BDA96_03G262100 [Sorghum bicolor]|uniref:Uncharacterized protein n=1 Tax=Sorghum bicolor TaxID=4558 RepID=A0A921UR52_SORBI|nr:hypothetical protein BDA96_03G262100 [Sorghum bicolor]